jgi:hypothetical protein
MGGLRPLHDDQSAVDLLPQFVELVRGDRRQLLELIYDVRHRRGRGRREGFDETESGRGPRGAPSWKIRLKGWQNHAPKFWAQARERLHQPLFNRRRGHDLTSLSNRALHPARARR